MRAKLCALAAAMCITWGLKHHYSTARTDELWWILAPTAKVVGATTGLAFDAAPGEGFISRERLFVIEKGCAGVNFMIAAFALVVLTLARRIVSALSSTTVLATALLISYAATIVVNAVRIIVALWLAAHPIQVFGLTAPGIHRVEGIAVYFAGLIALYEVTYGLSSNVTLQNLPSLGAPSVVLLRRNPRGAADERCRLTGH